MSQSQAPILSRLIATVLGAAAARGILDIVTIDPALTHDRQTASRAQVAMALNIVLMHGLLARVPSGAAYVADRRRAGRRIVFDHGALRTIRFAAGPMGALPAGEQAFTRILEPLGYELAGLYPLDRLRMTGRAYAHRDFPETIPQFFVSELHVERFSPEFQAAASRVFGASRDPLTDDARRLLASLGAGREALFDLAAAGLPALVASFGRQHPIAALSDYRALLAESAEAAWIATEGNAFNHVTDRVEDVESVASAQRALGRPMKDKVEISGSGRVRQTAFKADPVERALRGEDGAEITLAVPGSFYEFISRDRLMEGGGLDLGFDSGNAQGIFRMTAAA
jgi:hypothetical protein